MAPKRSSTCRRTWCSTSCSASSSRTTSRAVRRAAVSVAVRNAIKVPHREVVAPRWAIGRGGMHGGGYDGRIITGSGTVKVWRDGACERASRRIRASRCGGGAAGRGALWSAARATAPRSCGRSTALPSAPSHGQRRDLAAALPDGVQIVVADGRQVGCTTSTGRSSTPSIWRMRRVTRQSRVTPAGCGQWRRRRPPHQRCDHRQGGASLQEPRQHPPRAHRPRSSGGGDARRPAHPQRLDGQDRRVWLLDGTLVNTFRLHTSYDRHRGAAGQPARTLRLGQRVGRRQHGQALQRQRRRRPAHLHATNRVPLALPLDGLRFVSGSYDNTARIAYHGLACT